MIWALLVDPSSLPLLALKGMQLALPIFQGGMGVGVSLAPLASAVAVAGGLGLVSSAGLDRIVSKRLGRKVGIYEAVRLEVEAAKARGGFAGVNIMVALQRDFVASVRAALDAGADAIVSGAGLPLSLPAVQPARGTALIPIVSSARALEIICRRWERLHARPDAVVLEGPLAGGHLGFRADQVDLQENTLERLLPPVKEVAMAHGDLPVIVAGGVYSHEDIRRFLALGADGVQMGTRFLATEESSASPEYKQAVLRARPEDMVVATAPGSPCGLPFRVLRESPMYQEALVQARAPRCSKGYVLFKDADGRFTKCAAKDDNDRFFCICEGLFSAAGYELGREEPLYTAGTTAARVDRILPTSELMAELAGAPALLPLVA
jgi:nitronate monooxygenase